MEYTRSFALEDISVRSAADGRVVEAYASAFNAPADVRDQDGEYIEIIDPAAFNRAIEHARRAKGGWNIPVMFNHGMTIFHTPSERHSVPIGVPEEIRADKRGLFTRTRYHNTPVADEVLEAIRDGSITAYSFSGVFRRSDPPVPRGGFRPDRSGDLPTVRRTESTLREFGPATFPVNAGAEILGVRAEQVAMLLSHLAPGELDRLATLITSGTHLDPPEAGTPEDSGPAAEDPPEGHSARSPKQELRARYAEFIRRSAP
jgi:HK97 family phage prohead protease